MRNDLQSSRRPVEKDPTDWRRLIIFLILGTVVFWFGGSWIYRTFIQSDEDKIRGVIAAAAQGVVDHSPSSVSEFIDDSFVGPRGISKNDVHGALVFYLMSSGPRFLSVKLAPDPIPVIINEKTPKKAKATFQVKILSRENREDEWEAANPQGTGRQYHAEFIRTKDGWKLSKLAIEQ